MVPSTRSLFLFFFNDTPTTEIYTLSLTTLFRSPRFAGITGAGAGRARRIGRPGGAGAQVVEVDDLRSEEHTSELQSQSNLVCRLLLEKKKNEEADDVTLDKKGINRRLTPRRAM